MAFKIFQPDLINMMIQVFDEDMKLLTTFNNPATTNKGIVRNKETDTKISDNIQNRYSSGVESLLYLVNNSQPKLSNAVREISLYMDEANMSHYRAIIRAIKYVSDIKDNC